MTRWRSWQQHGQQSEIDQSGGGRVRRHGETSGCGGGKGNEEARKGEPTDKSYVLRSWDQNNVSNVAWERDFPNNQPRGPTEVEADRKQTGPEQNRQDQGRVRGKARQGEGGESNRVKLRERKGDQ